MDFELHHEHAWDVSPSEAVALQRRLAEFIREEPLSGSVETIAGVDVSIKGDRARAAVAVVRTADLSVIEEAAYEADVPFPYVPGLLTFREMPVILPALERLRTRPDLFMTDSQGRAHPRRMGLATHLGLLLDWPAVGVAKSRLTGTYAEPGPEKGAWTPLYDGDEVIGAVVRTRAHVKPVYVSVGHRVTLEEAVDLALACAPRFKIPVPTREAHRLSREWGRTKFEGRSAKG